MTKTVTPHAELPRTDEHSSFFGFAQRLMLCVLVAGLLLLAWQLSDLLLLLFGAIIVAVALRTLAAPLEKRFGWHRRMAVGVAVITILLIIVIGSLLMGDRLVSQIANLREKLPGAFDAITTWINSRPFGINLIRLWENVLSNGVPWNRLASAATGTLGAISSAGLMVVVGVYLAVDPALYRNGLVRLVPIGYRAKFQAALLASGHGLSRWLLGQGISMVFVGSSTALGLFLLGMPLALSIGVIAGVLAFIPFFGPIASGVLAVLLAFMEGPALALYVAALCLLIQQIEGNFLMPSVQKWAVELPPVLGITAAVIFGLLFGLAGIIFATPLMVVAMVLVEKLYVEDVLENRQGAAAT